jgi:hypothetical protein
MRFGWNLAKNEQEIEKRERERKREKRELKNSL